MMGHDHRTVRRALIKLREREARRNWALRVYQARKVIYRDEEVRPHVDEEVQEEGVQPMQESNGDSYNIFVAKSN